MRKLLPRIRSSRDGAGVRSGRLTSDVGLTRLDAFDNELRHDELDEPQEI